MPRNNKKRGAQKKGAGTGATNSHPPTDEENSIAGDNWSTASVLSDNSSTYENAPGSGIFGFTRVRQLLMDIDAAIENATRTIATYVEWEEQEIEDSNEPSVDDYLRECIDGVTDKSGPQRIKHLKALKKLLSMKYLADLLEDRKETTADNLLRSLKRGKSEEQTLAAECIALLALQLGPELDKVYDEIQSVLATRLADATASPQTRAQCASAMAMCCFLISKPKHIDVKEVESKMHLMEDVFKKCYRKSDGSLPQSTAQLSMMNTSCLDSWCFLLTRTPDFFIQDIAHSHIHQLADLLESPNTDLRMAAGKAMALLYELNRDIDEDFDDDVADTEALCEQLKDLSTESTKHMGRNARRQQKATFRDILQSVQDGDVAVETVQVGKLQTLTLDDWSSKIQYHAFCDTLQSGIDIHLQENVILRDFFDLGAPLPVGAGPANKMSKVQRKYYNNQANKARTVSRGKNRDKRSSVLGY